MCLFFEGKNHTKIAISGFGMLDRWFTKLEGTISIHWRQEKAKLTIETLEKCEICPKLTIKTPERRHWRRSGVLIINFEHISHLFSNASIVGFEQANVTWVHNNSYSTSGIQKLFSLSHGESLVIFPIFHWLRIWMVLESVAWQPTSRKVVEKVKSWIVL